MDTSQHLNFMAVIGMVGLELLTLRLMKRDIVFYFPICLGFLWTLVSVAYIENGTFITEQKEYSQPTGATFRYLLYCGIYLLSAGVSCYLLNHSSGGSRFEQDCSPRLSRRYIFFMFGFCVLSVIVLLLHCLVSGTAFTNSAVTRFNFWSDFAYIPRLRYLHDLLPNIILVLGLYLQHKKVLRMPMVIGTLTAIAIYYFLLGNKFTTFYALTWLLAISLIIGEIKISVGSWKKYGLCYIVLLVALMTFGLTHYLKADNMPVDEFLEQRILGLQGHLWWGMDREIFLFEKTDRDHIDREAREFWSPTVDHTEVGHRYLMLRVGGETAKRYIQDGVNFAGGFPAIVLVLFGPYFSVFALVLIGLLHSLVNYSFKRLLLTGDFLNIMIGTRIFMGYLDFILMGETIAIFNYKVCVYVFILALYNLCWNQWRQNVSQRDFVREPNL